MKLSPGKLKGIKAVSNEQGVIAFAIEGQDMSAVEVRIVQSSEQPGGMGETGISAVVPAVAGAIFAAIGKLLQKCRLLPKL